MWNESFTFEITEGKEPLTVIVMDQDIGSDDFEGKTAVPLDFLSDQQKHEQWFDLQGEGNQKWQGRIRLEMQWVWSQ